MFFEIMFQFFVVEALLNYACHKFFMRKNEEHQIFVIIQPSHLMMKRTD